MQTSGDADAVLDAAQGFQMDARSIVKLHAALDASPDKAYEVWQCNWPVLEAFLAVSSQWRVVSVGGGMSPALPVYIGLDYAAALAGLGAAGIDITPDLWSGVRTMEAAACAALNEVAR
ncbi:hypothetical protein X566_01540 [Afipia sp. P52-10]|uniref:DUF1799 domain-containing protein n=1 Tax=Afipia sp. P52-10 TaxID=1429916 RepID=UPI0003DF3A2D|nr:DUF1799 domain-containing protein [Afipia sp. P52-10]ETR79294.1 hypothetical protein X566_01540 [Afipia sp. P52-10]